SLCVGGIALAWCFTPPTLSSPKIHHTLMLKGWQVRPYVHPATIEALRHPAESKRIAQFYTSHTVQKKRVATYTHPPVFLVFPEEGAFVSPLYSSHPLEVSGNEASHGAVEQVSTQDKTFATWTHSLHDEKQAPVQAIMSGAYGVSMTDSLQTSTWQHYNSVVMLHKNTLQWSTKKYLVPFGETWIGMPRPMWVQWGNRLLALVRLLGVPLPEKLSCDTLFPLSFTSRRRLEIPTFTLPYPYPNKHPHEPLKLQALVCFELLHPQAFKTLWEQSALQKTTALHAEKTDALVNVSNLGWFHQQPKMHGQFLKHTYWLAYSLSQPIIMSNNDGFSGIITPNEKGFQSP
ncbi:MAG: hypothetical protein ACKO37_04265, partial [Vampirovibrionales bacterium]